MSPELIGVTHPACHEYRREGRAECRRSLSVRILFSSLLGILLLTGISLAAGIPKCPSGSGPAWRAGRGWKCEPGANWPSGENLKKSDCPPGTHFVQMYQEAACLPPAPSCPSGSSPFASDLTIGTPGGWACLQKPDCVPGSEAELGVQGWQCNPSGSGGCPKGSSDAGMCCGTCAPTEQKTCERLRGWEWVDNNCQLKGL
jgi:hypothetical protein